MVKFHISEEDATKIEEWKKEQNDKHGTDYYGAIGGVLTYSFTPTGLGCVVKVKHGGTGEELDLTNVEDW